MRLIDADELIVLELAGIEFVPKDFIDDAPTIDAVQVVRCKECEHSVYYKSISMRWCWRRGAEVNDEGFCSYGGRDE